MKGGQGLVPAHPDPGGHIKCSAQLGPTLAMGAGSGLDARQPGATRGRPGAQPCPFSTKAAGLPLRGNGGMRQGGALLPYGSFRKKMLDAGVEMSYVSW
jgi:hypothetical protein